LATLEYGFKQAGGGTAERGVAKHRYMATVPQQSLQMLPESKQFNYYQ
jgi:hypothetical protein